MVTCDNGPDPWIEDDGDGERRTSGMAWPVKMADQLARNQSEVDQGTLQVGQCT